MKQTLKYVIFHVPLILGGAVGFLLVSLETHPAGGRRFEDSHLDLWWLITLPSCLELFGIGFLGRHRRPCLN